MSHKWQHGVFSCLAAVVGMVLAGGTTGAGAQEEGADVQLNWVAGMGRGGATIARLSDRTTAEPAKATFTRLTAVVFPPGRREVVFVGEAVEGEAPLEPQELLDVLILALRALRRGEAPGVDMRPDATKLDGEGLVPEGAPMRVTYFGGIENTVLGLAAFGSDRLLKCLDFDKDNETRELFGCKVEGYRSGLELAAGMDGGVGSRWHRIWIEHSRSAVRRSPDGRTFIPEAELRVEPRAQDLVGGDWKDAKRPASPSARAFTDHLTRNYAAYARAYPVLRRLWEFAKLVSVAEALLPPEPGKADLARPALDWAWVLSEYQPQRVPTTASTPAARATREIKDGAGKPIGTLRMSGGVTLRPKNAYHDGDRLAEAIGAAALDALRREPARGNWPVAAQGRALQAAGCPMLSVETVRLWQTDLTVGGLEAVREFPLRDARPAIGGGWALRVPSLTVSRETVKLDSGDVVPREIRFRFGSRQEVFLDQHWKFTPPGQITVRNYRNLEGTAGLLCYKNFWYYVEGKLESLWAGGSPLGRGLRPGERV
ncbi:MAG: hypothetical protein FJ290_29650, partial [Planctomycetes bacterium]|nr:hypothetical protein [Planctomycetota bacterium]